MSISDDIRKHVALPFAGFYLATAVTIVLGVIWVQSRASAYLYTAGYQIAAALLFLTTVVALQLPIFSRAVREKTFNLIGDWLEYSVGGYRLFMARDAGGDLICDITRRNVRPSFTTNGLLLEVKLGGWFARPTKISPALTGWRAELSMSYTRYIGFWVYDPTGARVRMLPGRTYELLEWAEKRSKSVRREDVSIVLFMLDLGEAAEQLGQECATLQRSLNLAHEMKIELTKRYQAQASRLRKAEKVAGWCLERLGDPSPREDKAVREVRESLGKLRLPEDSDDLTAN